MIGWLTSPTESFAESAEIACDIALLVSTLIVVVGLIGEYRKGDRWKRYVHVFEVLVIAGVAGEMVTETGAFWYSLKLQSLQVEAVHQLKGAAFDAVKAADIANKAATKLQSALRIDALAQKALEQENKKLREALGAANTKIDSLEANTLGLERQQAQTSQQVAADHSVKARLRVLLTSIDPNILRNIDNGTLELTVRMQPSDYTELEKLLREPEGAKFLRIKGLGNAYRDSLIANGTLGPQSAVPFQRQVTIIAAPGLEGRE